MSTLPEVNDTDGRTDEQAKQAGMIIASRLLGSYIASSSWLEKVEGGRGVCASLAVAAGLHLCVSVLPIGETTR